MSTLITRIAGALGVGAGRDAVRRRRSPEELRLAAGRLRAGAIRRKFYSQGRSGTVVAAQMTGADPAWQGMPRDEDSQNVEFQYARLQARQRAEDLDVNNPDIRGFNRTRVAQILGDGVVFKFAPKPEEVGVEANDLTTLCSEVDRLREVHSECGGFDSTGKGVWEGIRQFQALLTAFVDGDMLIHRVWREDPNTLMPFSIELIAGARISTPYERAGDPLISYGVEYEDTNRTRVVGYHVRRVSQSRGDSYVPDYKWDFLPIEDCSLLSLAEMVGIDRALPLSVAVVRMARNRGEFMEGVIENVRAHSKIYATNECAPDADPYQSAADAMDQNDAVDDANVPIGFTDVSGVQMYFTAQGEKITFHSATLPDPDLPGFNGVFNSRMAAGMCGPVSTLTREVNNSFAGGRLEQQLDVPMLKQYRKIFCAAWRKVNQWFLEGLWLNGKIDLPGFSSANRAFWCQYRAQFPGIPHINPKEEVEAEQQELMLGTLSFQMACERAGHDYREILRQRAAAINLRRAVEEEFGLEKNELDPLYTGKAITAASGQEAAAAPAQTDPETASTQAKGAAARTKNGLRIAAYGACAMPTLADPVRVSMFRMALANISIDREKRMICGISIMAKGRAIGHEQIVDDTTLDQLVAFGQKAELEGTPIKCRENHPKQTNDLDVVIENDLARLLGPLVNWRRDGDCVRADLKLLSAEASPGSNRMMALSAEAPNLFGASIVSDQFKSTGKDSPIRIKRVYAVDLVDLPAANPTGLFAAGRAKEPPMDGTDVYVMNGGYYCMGADGKPMSLKISKEAIAKIRGDDDSDDEDDTDTDAAKHAARRSRRDAAAAGATNADADLDGKSPSEIIALGIKREREYRKEFDTIVSTVGLKPKESEEFHKDFYGLDLKQVKFLAQRALGGRAAAKGESGDTAGGTEKTPAQAAADAVKAEAEARFDSVAEVRESYGMKHAEKDSDPYKAARAKYVKRYCSLTEDANRGNRMTVGAGAR